MRGRTRVCRIVGSIIGRAHEVVRHGKIIEGALRRAEMSDDDLMEQVRLRANTARLDAVESAYLERNDDLSVISRE